MTNHDEKLGQLLKSLPRERAQEDFTGRVMERLEMRRPPVFSPFKIALVSAAAVVVAATMLSTVSHIQQKAEQNHLKQELKSVKAQYRKIARQIEELKNQPPRDPVIYVGGDDRADYVLDVSKLHIRLTGRETPQAMPNRPEVIDLEPTYPSAGVIQASYQGGAI
jgi:cell division protein FtsB